MFKSTRQEYCIKTCPTNELAALEVLLNSAAMEGWELYSLTETELNNKMYYNCIFVREALFDPEDVDF